MPQSPPTLKDTLKDIQDRLQDLIRYPEKKLPPEFLAKEKGVLKNLSAEDQLQVYVTDYRSRLVATLEEGFPVLRKILGTDSFESLVGRYVQKNPSQSHDLELFGKNLATFLKTDILVEDLPFLTDLVQVEWLLLETFHQEYQDTVSLTEWANLTPSVFENLIFKFQPSFNLVQSSWPLVKILQIKDLSESEIDIPLHQEEEDHLVIFQNPEGIVEWQSLTKKEFHLLKGLHSGNPFSQVCEEVLSDEDATFLQSCLQEWIESGWITALGI